MHELSRIRGEDFRRIMREKGWTQAKMGRHFQVSQAMISQQLRGVLNTGWLQLGIAQLLDIPVFRLFPDHIPRGHGKKPWAAPLNDTEEK
jgi:transcriptional regulator with XRE-family HTH domain